MGKMKIGDKIARQHNIIELLDNKIKLERRLQQATEILRDLAITPFRNPDVFCCFCRMPPNREMDKFEHEAHCVLLRAKKFAEEAGK